MELEEYEEAVRDYRRLTEVDASNRGMCAFIRDLFQQSYLLSYQNTAHCYKRLNWSSRSLSVKTITRFWD